MPVTSRASTRRLGLIASITVLLGVFFTSPAFAHTSLVGSTPAKNAEIGSPAEVTLVFSEPVSRARVQVRDAAGGTHQAGGAQVRGAKVTQRVAPGLAAGAYTVDYRVVSADGHPVQDSLPFKITAMASAAPTAAPGGAGAAPATGAEPAGGAQADSGTKPSGSGGTTKWFVLGAGLLAGIGIGVGSVALRRPKRTDDPTKDQP